MIYPLATHKLAIGYRRRRKPDIVLGSGLDLHLQRGKLVGLLGPNGVGKSTLLRSLAAVQEPLAGSVLLAGTSIADFKPLELARRLSMVLTSVPPPSLMNGYALVALGRQPYTDWLGRMSPADHDCVDWALDVVNAADLAHHPVKELSDGQRQKLMIARALAQQSEIILLDEPTAFLDLPRRIETMTLLKQLAQTAERAILVSTHDLDLALRTCDKLWLMSAAGIEHGAPEDLVLNGSLNATFRADGIHFDSSRGSFVRDASGGPGVFVDGEEAQTLWLRRALTRAGFGLSDKPGRIQVSQLKNGKGHEWRLQIAEEASRHHSIETLLSRLQGQTR